MKEKLGWILEKIVSKMFIWGKPFLRKALRDVVYPEVEKFLVGKKVPVTVIDSVKDIIEQKLIQKYL